MPSVTVQIQSNTRMTAVNGVGTKTVVMQRLVNHLVRLLSGTKKLTGLTIIDAASDALRSFGTLTFSGASGTVGGVINGVTLTFTHGASDQADANTMVSTINASTDASLQGLVTASNISGTLTLASVAVGTEIFIAGRKFTAISGTPQAGTGQFDVSGNDTADAASLVTAIKGMQGLNLLVCASSSAGVVTVRQVSGTTPIGIITCTAATVTISNFAASTAVCVASSLPGIAGNGITLVASGTGVTASAATLTAGTGATGSLTLIGA